MNITCKDCTGVVPDFQGDVAIPSEYSIDLNIPPGYYETVKDVTDQLNTYVRKLFSSPVKVWQTDNKDNAIFAEKFIGDTYWPSFKYNDVNRRVYCSIPPNMTLKFSKEMTTLLGMRQQTMTNNDKDTTLVKGHNVSDITAGIQNLHIYCDVLEMTPLGDSLVPLLRIVPVSDEKYGSNVTKYYESPRYVPLQKKQFDSIEIDIRDSFGEKIAFETGQVIVTLHFKRVDNPFFRA